MGISIITDSTSDIPKFIIEKYGIIEIPLTVHFGDEDFKDRLEITAEQFYEKLKTSRDLPTTSQVNPASFMDMYKRELEKGNSIISIHISSGLSGTYQSAVLAQQTLKDDRIAVIDSRSTSIALGILVLKGAELRDREMQFEHIVKTLEEFKQKVRIFLVADTLEYLRRGGRLSGTQAVLATMLNIKPIITVEAGKAVMIDKVRGKKRALARLVQLVIEKGKKSGEQLLNIGNAGCPEISNEIKNLLSHAFKDAGIIESEVGSVIATHAGPGAYGVAFIEA